MPAVTPAIAVAISRPSRANRRPSNPSMPSTSPTMFKSIRSTPFATPSNRGAPCCACAHQPAFLPRPDRCHCQHTMHSYSMLTTMQASSLLNTAHAPPLTCDTNESIRGTYYPDWQLGSLINRATRLCKSTQFGVEVPAANDRVKVPGCVTANTKWESFQAAGRVSSYVFSRRCSIKLLYILYIILKE